MAVPENMQMEALIDIMFLEAIKTSEIEGEYLDQQEVFIINTKESRFWKEIAYIPWIKRQRE